MDLRRRSVSGDELLNTAKDLFQDYVSPSGAYALNLTQTQISSLERALEENSDVQVNASFDILLEKVVSNMLDMFARFAHTTEYKEFKKQQEVEASAKTQLGWNN